MKFERKWAMPSPWTFSIKPINELLTRYLVGPLDIVDPFCGQSGFANHFNDLAVSGLSATEWLDSLIDNTGDGWADAVLLDPPYSPRQVSECYKGVGKTVGMKDTQTAVLYKESVERLDRLLKPGGIAFRFGWNSAGFGKSRGYEMLEILLVPHGGAHNDTIVTVERKPG
jgi:hypothetical protein